MEKITIDKTTIAWDPEKGICTFNGIPAVSMWVNSTYQHIMSSVVDMVGEERFLLALQKQGRESIADDWKIISQYPSFEQGLNELSRLAAIGGWGVKSLISLDYTNKHAKFHIHNGVEGLSQKAGKVCWGSGLIAGKLAGYCENLFGCKCWPEQIKFIAKGDAFDEFLITESNKSIEREMNRLLHTDQATKADMAVALKQLEKEVTYRITAENKSRKLANFDSLTGLTNRRYFNNELSSYLSIASKSQENGALLFMDLDNFKNINDSLGHEKGDLCLKEVTHRLLLRNQDLIKPETFEPAGMAV